jgi:sugar phosphate isomerase/epimerase
MKSAVTISLTPEARGGPFVFWDPLETSIDKAHRLGFDAVELFPPAASEIDAAKVLPLLQKHNLKVSSVGSGGGWVKHKLTLTSPDPAVRAKAKEFIGSLIDAAGALGAPVIIGSMQGRWGESVSREDALAALGQSLEEFAERAARHNVNVLYEPLNRYETNLIVTLAEGVTFLRALKPKNIKLLADLYHMNIEEANLPAALRGAGDLLGHVHLADSNRRPAGFGHTDFSSIARALKDINYTGYVSAECFPWPDPDSAAAKTMETIRKYFA